MAPRVDTNRQLTKEQKELLEKKRIWEKRVGQQLVKQFKKKRRQAKQYFRQLEKQEQEKELGAVQESSDVKSSPQKKSDSREISC